MAKATLFLRARTAGWGVTYPTEPAKSANQVVDELAEELAATRSERENAEKRGQEYVKALAQAEHHFQHIQKLAATLKWSHYVAASSILAHVTAGLDACRNPKAGK